MSLVMEIPLQVELGNYQALFSHEISEFSRNNLGACNRGSFLVIKYRDIRLEVS